MSVPKFFIQSELQWLENIINARIMFPNEDLRSFDISNNPKFLSALNLSGSKTYSIELPSVEEYDGSYVFHVQNYSFEERLLLILAIANDLNPGFIDKQLSKNGLGSSQEKDPNWLKSVGLVIKNNYGYVPTLWFFIYLVAGQNFSLRLQAMNSIKENEYEPIKNSLVNFEEAEDHEPVYGGILWVDKDKVLELIFE